MIESKALELRSQGRNYDEIGRELGIPPAKANTAVRRALARIRQETKELAEESRGLELFRLDQLFYHAFLHVRGGDVNAIDKALKVMERRSKLLGLDAAIKAEVTTKQEETLSLRDVPEDQMKLIEKLVLESATAESEGDDGIDLSADEDYGAAQLPDEKAGGQ